MCCYCCRFPVKGLYFSMFRGTNIFRNNPHTDFSGCSDAATCVVYVCTTASSFHSTQKLRVGSVSFAGGRRLQLVKSAKLIDHTPLIMKYCVYQILEPLQSLHVVACIRTQDSIATLAQGAGVLHNFICIINVFI